tara:strand:- start:4095 stop:4697 length:603 start_codon:yes stop_codon:yes gene_type:complete
MVLATMSFFVSEASFGDDKVKQVVEKAKAEVNRTAPAVREINKHGLGLGLGQTFLFGNFEKRGDNAITADILYSYTASYTFDLLVNAHFSTHEYKDRAVFLRGTAISIKGRSYEFDSFSPFLLGGLGFYMPQIRERDGTTSEAKYTFGVNFGGGVDLRLNDTIVMGVLAQYHHPFDIKQDETDTVRGSYFKLLLTCMYLF